VALLGTKEDQQERRKEMVAQGNQAAVLREARIQERQGLETQSLLDQVEWKSRREVGQAGDRTHLATIQGRRELASHTMASSQRVGAAQSRGQTQLVRPTMKAADLKEGQTRICLTGFVNQRCSAC